MSDHTRGPWRWQFFGKLLALVGAYSDTPIVLDCTPKGQMRIRDGLPMREVTPLDLGTLDLRLIEAAPDLLEYAMLETEWSNVCDRRRPDWSHDQVMAFVDKYGIKGPVGEWLGRVREAAVRKAWGIA